MITLGLITMVALLGGASLFLNNVIPAVFALALVWMRIHTLGIYKTRGKTDEDCQLEAGAQVFGVFLFLSVLGAIYLYLTGQF